MPPTQVTVAGVGRRHRQRQTLVAPSSRYSDSDGNLLVLRGSLSPATRREYSAVLAGGAEREDSWQRAAEMLFERLVLSWEIAGLRITRQQELLGRYRVASDAERQFVRRTLREHLAEHFPELRAP